jgi:hypothetical protein
MKNVPMTEGSGKEVMQEFRQPCHKKRSVQEQLSVTMWTAEVVIIYFLCG